VDVGGTTTGLFVPWRERDDKGVCPSLELDPSYREMLLRIEGVAFGGLANEAEVKSDDDEDDATRLELTVFVT
jgi:hypothetical protein